MPKGLPSLALAVVKTVVRVCWVRSLSWMLGTSKEANNSLPRYDMASDRLGVQIFLEWGSGVLVHLGSYDLHANQMATMFGNLLCYTSHALYSLVDHPYRIKGIMLWWLNQRMKGLR